MDFVKREDHNVNEDENYKIYMENLQKSQQMESDYQHTAISMEQLHQAMQSTINSSIVHNFQLPLSPRQMSTLMMKTNPLRSFNEMPVLSRNLSSDMDLAQNLTHDLPTHLRHEDLLMNRNLDLSLVRNLSSDLESANLIQNLSEQDLSRINSDLNRIVDVMPQLQRNDLPPNVPHEIDLSHHMNRQNIEQELIANDRRSALAHMQESQILEQNLVSQRLVNSGLSNLSVSIHEGPRPMEQNEQMLPMPFQIKSEQEDDGYFYDTISHGMVNGLNNHILPDAQSPSTHDPQMYVYSNHMQPVPALNPIDLYSRPQYLQNYQNTRDNPQNLVVHRQFDNNSPYQEEYTKNDHIPAKIDPKEQPKENLKPTDQNKIYYPEFGSQIFPGTDTKNNNEAGETKLTISEDNSMIKGEYVCYKCNNVFPSKRGLKQHAKSCTENDEVQRCEKLGKFACTQCSYRCQSPAILKIHERTHSGEKPFSCTFCDYKSGQKNNVAKHIMVHMKEKPFQCQYCDYRCAQKNNLVVHERTHTGYKPFACSFCEYRTVQKPNLVKHLYLHTNQKPFSCDMCNYRCVQKTNLTKHKQRHLNEKEGDKLDVKNQTKPYRPRQKSVKCPHCQYRCVQKSSLEKHLQFKHSDMPVGNLEEQFDTEELEKVSGSGYADKGYDSVVRDGYNVDRDKVNDAMIDSKDIDDVDRDNYNVINEGGDGCEESINLSVKREPEHLKEPVQKQS